VGEEHSFAALKTAGAAPTWILHAMLVSDLREKSEVALEKVQSKVTDGWRAGIASLEGGRGWVGEKQKSSKPSSTPLSLVFFTLRKVTA